VVAELLLRSEYCIRIMMTKTFKYSLAVAAIYCSFLAVSAQEGKAINQRDKDGKQTGVWYIKEPATRGEPGFSQFGSYEHGNKTGIWYTADDKGSITAIETYKYNFKDGEAQYFEDGQLVCVGHFRALNPRIETDTVLLVHPETGEEKIVYIPTERGSVKHGRWRFYDETTGRLIREQQWQADELISSQDFTITPQDSIFYEKRNAVLPHIKKPQYKHKQIDPVKSLISR